MQLPRHVIVSQFLIAPQMANERKGRRAAVEARRSANESRRSSVGDEFVLPEESKTLLHMRRRSTGDVLQKTEKF